MPIYQATDENIKNAAGLIKKGELVAFPTETVYGLGADAYNPVAVAKIFDVKKRPFFDPLIVHVADKINPNDIALKFNAVEKKLMEKFWPGPLTLIVRKTSKIPDIVTSGLQTVGIRMPENETAEKLINESGRPIAAPSANLFGRLSPVKAEHVQRQLKDKIQVILDGGECKVGIESTIIKVENDIPVILRYGGIAVEEIKKITGSIKESIALNMSLNINENIESPGQFFYHYSPVTPLKIIDDLNDVPVETNNAGLLSFRIPGENRGFKHIETLSSAGDLTEAAARLFKCMHNLDSAGLDIIYAEKVPQRGLGIAIMDRLTRASKRYTAKK